MKKVVDTEKRDFEEMKEKVKMAADAAVLKKKRVLTLLNKTDRQ